MTCAGYRLFIKALTMTGKIQILLLTLQLQRKITSRVLMIGLEQIKSNLMSSYSISKSWSHFFCKINHILVRLSGKIKSKCIH